MNCPICGKEIGRDDLLLVDYFEPKKWWVTHHFVPCPPEQTPDLTWVGQQYVSWCGQANIKTVVDK